MLQEFKKPIGKVWRRLRVQRFLTALVWCLGLAMLLAAGVIGAEKLMARPIVPADWVPFAVAGGAGVLLAALVALLTGPSRLDAAIAIDRAFHLNERLGTVITLPDHLRETPAGRALIEDTKRHLDRLDLGSKFGPRLPRTAWVPLVPTLLAVGLLFAPEFSQSQAQANAIESAEDLENIAKEAEALKKRMAEASKKLDKADYAETEKLLVEIQKAADDLAKAPPAEKEKALVKLNALTNALEERQKQIGDSEAINRKLQQLRQMTSEGPADEFMRELAKGDFQQAAEAVKELRDKLLSGKMTEQEKQELREQLAEMKKQLEAMANLDERKKQLEEALKKGAISKEQYERQMAKLNDQAEDLKKLQQLAQQLGQAQKQLSQGNMQQAANALGMSQDQLQQMASDLAELETLDGMNAFGQGMGMGQNTGQGLGRGRGRGDRPIADDDTSAYSTRVRQQLTRGKAVQEGFGPPGSQTIGESIIEAQQTIQTNPGAAADALTNQKVPKHIEQHVQSYLDSFRDDR